MGTDVHTWWKLEIFFETFEAQTEEGFTDKTHNTDVEIFLTSEKVLIVKTLCVCEISWTSKVTTTICFNLIKVLIKCIN